MAPQAGKIRDRRRTATFEIEGDEWVIEYRPFSSDTLREATQGDDSEQFDGICKLLGQTVATWNLEDDGGKPMDVQVEGMNWLRSVGLDYVRLLLDGIVGDMGVGKQNAPR